MPEEISAADIDDMLAKLNSVVQTLTEIYAKLPHRQTVEIAEYDMGLRAKRLMKEILVKLGDVMASLNAFKMQLMEKAGG